MRDFLSFGEAGDVDHSKRKEAGPMVGPASSRVSNPLTERSTGWRNDQPVKAGRPWTGVAAAAVPDPPDPPVVVGVVAGVVLAVVGRVVVLAVGAVVAVVGGVVVVPVGAARVQTLWAMMTSWATGNRLVMRTALTVRVSPERVCSFSTKVATPGMVMVVLGPGFAATLIGTPGTVTGGRLPTAGSVVDGVESARPAKVELPVRVVPLAVQVEVMREARTTPARAFTSATVAVLVTPVAFGVELAVSTPVVNKPGELTERTEGPFGGAVGVGAILTSPVALTPKAEPIPGAGAAPEPVPGMSRAPAARRPAVARPTILDETFSTGISDVHWDGNTP